jgi:hypothetical protein
LSRKSRKTNLTTPKTIAITAASISSLHNVIDFSGNDTLLPPFHRTVKRKVTPKANFLITH